MSLEPYPERLCCDEISFFQKIVRDGNHKCEICSVFTIPNPYAHDYNVKRTNSHLGTHLRFALLLEYTIWLLCSPQTEEQMVVVSVCRTCLASHLPQ